MRLPSYPPLAALFTAALFVGACSDPPPAPDFSRDGGEPVAEIQTDRVNGNETPFADLRMIFEFNSTDNDLGVQLFLDAEGWERVVGVDPSRRRVLDVMAQGRLRELGITELFFESAEPSPGEVLALFPAGTYRYFGRTVEGDELFGEATLSHALPPAPVFTPADGAVLDRTNVVIAWQPIAGLAGYQVIVVNEVSGETLEVDLKANVTSFPVPAAFLQPNTLHKAEVLAIGTNGNKTITEATFSTRP